MSDSSTEGYEVPQSKLVSKIGGIVFTILAIGAILFFLRGGDDDPSDQTSQPIERQYSLNQTWFAPPSEQLDHFEGVWTEGLTEVKFGHTFQNRFNIGNSGLSMSSMKVHRIDYVFSKTTGEGKWFSTQGGSGRCVMSQAAPDIWEGTRYDSGSPDEKFQLVLK